MQFSSILLGLAAPPAQQAVRQTLESATDVVEGVSEAFASILNQADDGSVEDASAREVTANDEQISSVGRIVGEFQRWLRDLGLGSGPSEVRVDLDAAGEARIDVAGVSAQEIQAALSTSEQLGQDDEPAWASRLRQLAVGLQHEASQVRGGSVPAVSLSIRETDYHVSVAG